MCAIVHSPKVCVGKSSLVSRIEMVVKNVLGIDDSSMAFFIVHLWT